MSKNLKNRTASLRTEYALEHHAVLLAPIKRALQDALLFSGVMHKAESVQGGANSWKLVLGDGREFLVRGRLGVKVPHIEVRQYGYHARTKLTNARDALRFVEKL